MIMNNTPTQQPAIIFDMGGVLIDWNPRYLYRKLFANEAEMEWFLAEVCTQDWNVQQDAGRPFAEGVAALTAQFPAHTSHIRAFDERWDEMVRGPIAGTVTILEELAATGYPLYGLTNWSAEKFAQTRPRYAFFRHFRHILVSGQVKLIKPDPRIYQLLLDHVQRPAAECLFIDDSVPNVDAAQQLGFDAIHFQSPAQLRAELAQRRILTSKDSGDGTRD